MPPDHDDGVGVLNKMEEDGYQSSSYLSDEEDNESQLSDDPLSYGVILENPNRATGDNDESIKHEGGPLNESSIAIPAIPGLHLADLSGCAIASSSEYTPEEEGIDRVLSRLKGSILTRNENSIQENNEASASNRSSAITATQVQCWCAPPMRNWDLTPESSEMSSEDGSVTHTPPSESGLGQNGFNPDERFEPLVPRFPPHLENVVPSRIQSEENILRHVRGVDYEKPLEMYSKSCTQFVKYVENEEPECHALQEHAGASSNALEMIDAKLNALSNTSMTTGDARDAEQALTLQRNQLQEDIASIGDNLRARHTEAAALVGRLMNHRGDASPVPNTPAASTTPHKDGAGLSATAASGVTALLCPMTGLVAAEKEAATTAERETAGYPQIRAKFQNLQSKLGGGKLKTPAEDSADKPASSAGPIIPEWFPHLDALGRIPLQAETPADRYTELLNMMYRLEKSKEADEAREEAAASTPSKQAESWDKNWHEPHPGWPHKSQRDTGGWWRCRSGSEATEAERRCRQCNGNISVPGGGRAGQQQQQQQPQGYALDTAPSAGEQYDDLMAVINESMATVAEGDKEVVLAALRDAKTAADK